jgi:Arc/MetJ family transcription regulator
MVPVPGTMTPSGKPMSGSQEGSEEVDEPNNVPSIPPKKELARCILFMHTYTYNLCIFFHEDFAMRTTLNIDDELIERASRLTGIKEKTSLVKLGLQALIARESSARLARLGGTERKLKISRRRRTPRA